MRWSEVEPFVRAVALIKPTRSPVFASKFCHFLLPAVFPVVDRAVLGNWSRMPYSEYFDSVRQEWLAVDAENRRALTTTMRRRIEAAGRSMIPLYPMAIKITELRRIGRASISTMATGTVGRSSES
ncbi:hypothetical protein F4553_001427 [Allocatelliglobosispora scoriae]|uniref:Uncharacterized protein n=1 Tax=Allocatelliglobosispora scoriae TaxID=643052 RepID=A0A841BL04_9ACTN|nr:hypothetical protein [Allocatelliglobosispora scoriae]MBB5868048.1 hypothetical protein [Allocatelliglobosispora scoriae]